MKAKIRALYHAALQKLPDSAAVSLNYYRTHRRLPNLRKPRSFNEKLLARMLRTGDHPKMAPYADKVSAKAIVASIMGPEFVIPNLWVGDVLPARPDPSWGTSFAIKGAQGSGMNLLVRDVAKADWSSIKRTADGWAKQSYGEALREGWYQFIPRRILIEPLIGELETSPPDYKFFVFAGKVAMIQVDTSRFDDHKRTLFSPDWTKLQVKYIYPQEDDLPAPAHLKEMVAAAEKLGANFEFVRVDLYDLATGPVFGELTFAPESGLGVFSPTSFDYELGRLWVERPGLLMDNQVSIARVISQ